MSSVVGNPFLIAIINLCDTFLTFKTFAKMKNPSCEQKYLSIKLKSVTFSGDGERRGQSSRW